MALEASLSEQAQAPAEADDSDEVLMIRYQRGDAAAFEILYLRHRDPVFRFLFRGISDRERADEMFQDVWASVIRSRQRWEPRAKFTTWLYRMAHNRLVDHYRAARPPAEDLDAAMHVSAAESDGPEHTVARSQKAQQLIEALARLPAEQREAFVMQQETGMSLEEIAEATGVGRETVKSRLRYAIAKLRQELSDD